MELFNHFQKIIYMNDGEWTCGFYSHYSRTKNKHILTNGLEIDNECILSYDGYNTLVGTAIEISPELNEGQEVYVNNCDTSLDVPGTWNKKEFYKVLDKEIDNRGFLTKEYKLWKYLLTASDFKTKNFDKILIAVDGKLEYKK